MFVGLSSTTRMRGGVLTGVSPPAALVHRVLSPSHPFAEQPKIKLEPLAAVVLTRTPLGALVRWVAGIPASLHTKLMAAFLVVTLLFIAMAGFSVRTLLETAQHSQQLDEAHERVAWSQQIEQALARQMHFSVLALLSRDEAAIGRDPAREQPFQRAPRQARCRRAARAARSRRADAGVAGRGDVGRGRHGQCHPRPQHRRCHHPAAASPGAHRRRDLDARGEPRQCRAGAHGEAARQHHRRRTAARW